jgi:hypothetical protein
MEIPREMVVEHIRSHGDYEQAEQAERELPEKVDPERDRDVLTRFGVDAAAFDFGGHSPEAG